MEEKVIQRQNWIDAAKVIAILVVVLNHSGLVIPGVNFWGGMFFVPSFFLLAGYTYFPKEESYGCFIKRKAKRLLIPYVAANGLLFAFFTLKDLLTGAWDASRTGLSFIGILYGRNQLLKEGFVLAPVHLMINLNAPTWFLPALFLVLLWADGVYRLTKGDKKRIALILALSLLAGVIYCYFGSLLLPWSLDVLPVLLLFFYVGYVCRQKGWIEKLFAIPRYKAAASMAFLLLVLVISGLLNGSFNLSISFYGKSVMLCILAAVTSSLLLMYGMKVTENSLPKLIKSIGSLSNYTLTILCYHYFFMQMFYAVAGALIPELWSRRSLTVAVQIMGIAFSVIACVVLQFLYGTISKSLFHKKIK